ncbi:uncharacterized protein LOC101849348 [Aplysia californica]|uniref:Uncharacterized protein LOC101849348 n=1 Tax=Aplysia californica TaxID=6500 RepID=A0ABM0JDN1_APLCA|nr:uncharacterized protein LOC101849348 [Aplysia californica]XP_005091274.1 uncharacterized protein LOC101849348 [Aplysia californica]XP_005091275.1 uncharacterized protein LOC101849348 [Aplysia californica]XP_005091276.1 uncharacterized protein LOC101849348 [Aplysia californica]XP_005091277.1 uncharacterized protein LOC101849348 [Aplysia californica]
MSLRVLHFQNETNASCPDLCGQGYKASFHNHSSAKGPRKKIYHGHLEGKGPRKGEHAAVKVFRDAAGTESKCDAEISKHKMARKIAKRFNKFVPDDHYQIKFTLPLKSTVDHLGVGFYLTPHKSRHVDKKEWVLIEENLLKQGEFQVFIRKTGERLGKDPTSLDAFLHYSYHESQGHHVMCGLQGVQTEKGYLLTTPCIHSVDSSFGSATDKGPKGIVEAFKFHKCNNLCYCFLRPDTAELETLGVKSSVSTDEERRTEEGETDEDAEDDGLIQFSYNTSMDAVEEKKDSVPEEDSLSEGNKKREDNAEMIEREGPQVG